MLGYCTLKKAKIALLIAEIKRQIRGCTQITAEIKTRSEVVLGYQQKSRHREDARRYRQTYLRFAGGVEPFEPNL